ncbi:AgmX/PglI C-terminal domain-containing protein [Archangium gephyra]|uniref:AgmX/PglI C-terminal domain-containing protein n=1 Tax=Archangium gephyra TaxID=48 RepID=UPI0035D495CE
MRNMGWVLMALALGGCAAGSKPSPSTPQRLAPLGQADQDGGTDGPDRPDGGSGGPGLDKEQIRSVIEANRGDIRECYERALEQSPQLQGLIAVRFMINADGSVSDPVAARNTVGDAGLEQCIASKMTAWRFPPVADGGRVAVTYPFLFRARQEPDAGTPNVGIRIWGPGAGDGSP